MPFATIVHFLNFVPCSGKYHFGSTTYSYDAEYNTAQYTGTYTVTELGITAKIGGLTNFNVIDYGTNGQTVKPAYLYDMVKGAYDGFTIEGDYKVGDVLNIFVVFDSDWYASIIINVQAGGTTPAPDPTPTPTPTPTPEVQPTVTGLNIDKSSISLSINKAGQEWF